MNRTRLRRYALVIGLPVLASCLGQPAGRWVWIHENPEYAERYRSRDIDDCETEALTMKDDMYGRSLLSARDYGGWGDFDFEFCMRQRGWALEFQPLEKTSPDRQRIRPGL